MHKETKASEQVCKECGRPESYVGHTRYAMDTHHFEPASPSTPAAEPPFREGVGIWNYRYRDDSGVCCAGGNFGEPHDCQKDEPSSPSPAQEPHYVTSRTYKASSEQFEHWRARAEAAEAKLAALPSEEEIAQKVREFLFERKGFALTLVESNDLLALLKGER